MALAITKWNLVKIFLFIFDIIIFCLNIILFFFVTYIIYNEYYYRGTLKLFFTPFILSIVNILIDYIMNKTSYIMVYAGHNRYGMLTRFFMFYIILTIIIYSDQRCRYIIKDVVQDFKNYTFILGIIDIGFIFMSMILSFCVIDVQSFKQILSKRKKKRTKTEISVESVGSMKNMEIPDL